MFLSNCLQLHCDNGIHCKVANYLPYIMRRSFVLFTFSFAYCLYLLVLSLHPFLSLSIPFSYPFFRHTAGDTKVPFCLQSCVKPLKYAIAVHDHGTEYVHRFIGKEPSGLRFNKLFLNEEGEGHTYKDI